MFSGYYSMHARCGNCGLRYQTSSGAWLGAIAIGYGIGALAAIVLTVVEVTWRPIRELGLDPMWTIAVVSLVMTAVGYRWAKGIWFALLHRWDFMAYGDMPPGPPPDASTRGGTPPREP